MTTPETPPSRGSTTPETEADKQHQVNAEGAADAPTTEVPNRKNAEVGGETGAAQDASGQDAWKEKWLRARADYDNLQRRVARDAALERERAKARVLEGFLPVFELAQMAAHQAEAHPGPVSEGVVLMAREFSRLLEREGLTPFGAPGDAFDAKLHEAVGHEMAPGIQSGHIARTVLPGYRIGDKVLRYAKVLVVPSRPTDRDKSGGADATTPQGSSGA